MENRHIILFGVSRVSGSKRSTPPKVPRTALVLSMATEKGCVITSMSRCPQCRRTLGAADPLPREFDGIEIAREAPYNS